MRISVLLDLAFRTGIGAVALVAAPYAPALSLGDAATQSALGQPLRVVVPIGAAPDQALTAACVRVIADAAGAGRPPRLLTGRVTIDRGAAEPRLVVTTRRPVNDPVVRLAVQAGCDGSTRRDYVLLLDPPVVGADATSTAAAARSAMPGPRPHAAPVAIATPRSAVIAREGEPDAAPSPAAMAAAPRQPAILLASPGGSSFIPEATAAGLPRTLSRELAAMPDTALFGLAPWWPLGVALVIVGVLALWLLPIGRRDALEVPAWIAPTARTEPNDSAPGGSTSRTPGRSGHFAAMTEPGPGFPRGNTTGTRAAATTTRAAAATTRGGSARTTRGGLAPAAAKPAPPEDPRFAEFDADLIAERTIRAEWAKAVNDGAIDIGGDSILKAIDDAERATQGAAAPPAQVALDRSLDDELLPNKARR